MSNVRAADTGAPLDFFKKQGYYQVGDRVFATKVSALQHATSTKQSVRWYFATDEFKELDWKIRLGVDIRSLYRMRAQQIRDNYSYLQLAWSGGGDSTQALLAFLENGIRVDEVITWWPYSFMRDKSRVSYEKNPENIISEWYLSIFPQMQALKSRFPHQKFTVLDENFESGIDDSIVEDQDDTLRVCDHAPNYWVIKRMRNVDRHYDTRNRVQRDVCMVTGVAPINLVNIDQFLCVWPSDAGALHRSDYLSNGVSKRTEWFYLTPDFPELAREIAHYMLDHFRANPSDIKYLPYLTIEKNHELRSVTLGNAEKMRMIYKKTVYPGYDPNTFQVEKPTSVIENPSYAAHYLHMPGMENLTDAWQYHLTSQISTIDPKFCFFNEKNKLRKFKTFFSQHRVIGRLPETE